MRKNKIGTDSSYSEEDKMVVANMNIEGMPWHLRGKPVFEESKEPLPELTKKELRKITLSATLGALLIASVFGVVFFLFIMFCMYIWF